MRPEEAKEPDTLAEPGYQRALNRAHNLVHGQHLEACNRNVSRTSRVRISCGVIYSKLTPYNHNAFKISTYYTNCTLLEAVKLASMS